jgi:hypothetical protein
MSLRSGLKVLLAAPLVLVDLGLLLVAVVLLGEVLDLLVRVFPALWPMLVVAVASTSLYLAGLFFVAADHFQHGIRALLSPQRLLPCSPWGLAMNAFGALLAVVICLVTLASAGAF